MVPVARVRSWTSSVMYSPQELPDFGPQSGQLSRLFEVHDLSTASRTSRPTERYSATGLQGPQIGQAVAAAS